MCCHYYACKSDIFSSRQNAVHDFWIKIKHLKLRGEKWPACDSVSVFVFFYGSNIASHASQSQTISECCSQHIHSFTHTHTHISTFYTGGSDCHLCWHVLFRSRTHLNVHQPTKWLCLWGKIEAAYLPPTMLSRVDCKGQRRNHRHFSRWMTAPLFQ